MVRDSKGRFKKGVSGNPGGMKKSEFSISALIDECVSTEDWRAMINKVRDYAKNGNLKCIEWLADRRFGKPMQPVSGTGKDGAITITVIYDQPKA